ncbi:MAG: LysR family transcriptional regulator [Acetobacteraceae bacterium]
MEMHQIRYFLAAAKAMNFTRAAEQCHISQPALTTAVKRLEEFLGSPLFHRDGRRLALTEFGRRMQPHLEQILEQTAAAEALAKDFRLLDQVPIRLGVMSTIGPMRLTGLFTTFEAAFPGIDTAVIDGTPEGLAAQLDADELDLAILNPRDGLGSRFHTEPLYTERYVVLLPPGHRLTTGNAIALCDLSNEAYVDRLSCEMREMVMDVCGDLGIRLYARFRSAREDWVQAMVMAGLGFAFMPEYAVTHPQSVTRPLIDPPVQRTISLVTVPGRKHSPAVSAFVRAARQYRWTAHE